MPTRIHCCVSYSSNSNHLCSARVSRKCAKSFDTAILRLQWHLHWHFFIHLSPKQTTSQPHLKRPLPSPAILAVVTFTLATSFYMYMYIHWLNKETESFTLLKKRDTKFQGISGLAYDHHLESSGYVALCLDTGWGSGTVCDYSKTKLCGGPQPPHRCPRRCVWCTAQPHSSRFGPTDT